MATEPEAHVDGTGRPGKGSVVKKEKACHGLILACDRDVVENNLKKESASLPTRYRDFLQGISPGTPIFLYDTSDGQLHGVFEASSSESSKSSAGIQDRRNGKHQAHLRLMETHAPLSDRMVQAVMKLGDVSESGIVLSHSQVKKLLDMFKVDERNDDEILSPKRSETEEGGEWEHVKTKAKGGRINLTLHHKSSSGRRASSPSKWRSSTAGGQNGSSPSNNAYSSFSQDRDPRRSKISNDKPKADRTDAPRWRSDPDSWASSSSGKHSNQKIDDKQVDQDTEQPRPSRSERRDAGGKRHGHQRSASTGASAASGKGFRNFDHDSNNEPVQDNTFGDNLNEEALQMDLNQSSLDSEAEKMKEARVRPSHGKKESGFENGLVRPVTFAAAVRGIKVQAEKDKAEGEKEKSTPGMKVAEKNNVKSDIIKGEEHLGASSKSHRGKGKGSGKASGTSSKVAAETSEDVSSATNSSLNKSAWKKGHGKEATTRQQSDSSLAAGWPTNKPMGAGLSRSEDSEATEKVQPKILEPSAPSKPAWKGDGPAVLRGLSTAERNYERIAHTQSAIPESRRHNKEAILSRKHSLQEHVLSQNLPEPLSRENLASSSVPSGASTIGDPSGDVSNVPGRLESHGKLSVDFVAAEGQQDISSEQRAESCSGTLSNSHLPPPPIRLPQAKSFPQRSSSFGRNSSSERNSRKISHPVSNVNGLFHSQQQNQVQVQSHQQSQPATGSSVMPPCRIGTPPLVHAYHHQHYTYSQSQPQSPQSRVGFEPESPQVYRPFVRGFMEPTAAFMFPGGDGLFSPNLNPNPVLNPLVGYPHFPLPHPTQTVNAALLHEEILNYAELVRPSKLARARAEAAIECVRSVVKTLWPGAEVEGFGSFATGLALPNSDVDVAIVNAPPPPDTPETLALQGARINAPLIRQLAPLLQKESWCESLYTIETARIPVIKLRCIPKILTPSEDMAGPDANVQGLAASRGAPRGSTAPQLPIAMDITIAGRHQNVLEGLENGSKEWVGKLAEANMAHNGEAARDFVKDKLQSLPALAPLVLLLKSWLQHRGLNDVYSGGLGSFALTLMVAFYLERAPISIGVPSMYDELSTSSESSGLSSPQDGSAPNLPQKIPTEQITMRKDGPLPQNKNGFTQSAGSVSPHSEAPSHTEGATSDVSSISEPSAAVAAITEPVEDNTAAYMQRPTTTLENLNVQVPSKHFPTIVAAQSAGDERQLTETHQEVSSNNNSVTMTAHVTESTSADAFRKTEQIAVVPSGPAMEYAYPIFGIPMPVSIYDPYGTYGTYEMDPRSMIVSQIMPPMLSYGDNRLVLRLPEYRRRRRGTSVVEKLPSCIKSVPSPNYGVLLIGFLQAFGYEFDFSKVRLVLKNEYGLMDGVFLHDPSQQRPTSLWIDDPLRPGANIGAGSFAITNVQASFRDLLASIKTHDQTAIDEAHNRSTYLLDKAFNSPMSPPDIPGRATSM